MYQGEYDSLTTEALLCLKEWAEIFGDLFGGLENSPYFCPVFKMYELYGNNKIIYHIYDGAGQIITILGCDK